MKHTKNISLKLPKFTIYSMESTQNRRRPVFVGNLPSRKHAIVGLAPGGFVCRAIIDWKRRNGVAPFARVVHCRTVHFAAFHCRVFGKFETAQVNGFRLIFILFKKVVFSEFICFFPIWHIIDFLLIFGQKFRSCVISLKLLLLLITAFRQISAPHQMNIIDFWTKLDSDLTGTILDDLYFWHQNWFCESGGEERRFTFSWDFLTKI